MSESSNDDREAAPAPSQRSSERLRERKGARLSQPSGGGLKDSDTEE